MKRIYFSLILVMLLILLDVSIAQGNQLPDTAYITGVNGHPQKHSLSCEARSAADLAAFWGVSLGENEFLGVLPRSDNPEQGFVGSPDGGWGSIPPHSYGVHAGPVAETLRSFGLHAEAHNNLSWDDVRGEISSGRPVIVWIIGQMWTGRAVEYQAPDGSTSIVAAFEHTMILVGYNQATVQIVDAFSGQYQTYALKSFLDSWAVLGNMAVFSSLEEESSIAPPVDVSEQTYTVQLGEYLTELANRFGTSLEELIVLNDIAYPYTIYPGQVLQLPGTNSPSPESEAVEPIPEPSKPETAVNATEVEAYLPFVQRDYSAPGVSVSLNKSDAQGVIPQLAIRDGMTGDKYCASSVVDWALLARLRELLIPTLLNTREIFLR